MKAVQLDIDVITRMHVEAKLSPLRISKTLQCSPTRVRRALKDAGVSITVYRFSTKHQSAHAPYYNKDYLQREYVEKGRTLSSIAEEFDVWHATIARALRRHGIAVVDRGYNGKSMQDHRLWKGVGQLPQSYVTRLQFGAANRNIPFEITITYLWELFERQGGRCALSNREIDFRSSHKGTASVDRIDSSKGYVAGNVWWVHKDINAAKQQFTVDEFRQLCKDVATFALEEENAAKVPDIADQSSTILNPRARSAQG